MEIERLHFFGPHLQLPETQGQMESEQKIGAHQKKQSNHGTGGHLMTTESLKNWEVLKEVAALHKRIAELEMQVVRMEYYDDNITESRVFRIEFSKLLNPEEAMSIFMRNIERIFSKPSGSPGQFN